MGQTAAIKQLSATLKYILAAARERCCNSGRHGKSGGGDRGAEESEDGAGRNGSQYSETETGDTEVSK